MITLLCHALDAVVGFILFAIVGPILRVCDPKGTRTIKRLRESQRRERELPRLTPEQRDRLWRNLQEYRRTKANRTNTHEH